MGVSGQRHAPAALYPQYPLDTRLAPEPVWTQGIEEKFPAPVRDRTPAVQPVVKHYTAWATAAPKIDGTKTNLGWLFLKTGSKPRFRSKGTTGKHTDLNIKSPLHDKVGCIQIWKA
jgi:hypothetical protein